MNLYRTFSNLFQKARRLSAHSSASCIKRPFSNLTNGMLVESLSAAGHGESKCLRLFPTNSPPSFGVGFLCIAKLAQRSTMTLDISASSLSLSMDTGSSELKR